MDKLPEAEFLRDVSGHQMNVLHEDGIYRHIRFRRPGDSCYWFDLVTIPGKLIYTGDMGTFVFARLEDMFEFFRTDREYAARKGHELCINSGYWAEKLLAVDGASKGSCEEFDADAFRRVINEYRVGWMRSAYSRNTLDKDQRRELWDAVEDDVLSNIDEYGTDVQRLAYDFRHSKHYFSDLFEHRFTRYTRTFLWCCYAIAWGVKTYDESKQLAVVA